MEILNLSTNELVARFVGYDEDMNVVSQTAWAFHLPAGAAFNMAAPWENPRVYLELQVEGTAYPEYFESLEFEPGKTHGYIGTATGNVTGLELMVGGVAPLNGDQGVYLASRYQLVASFMLVGIALCICYQAGRKGS